MLRLDPKARVPADGTIHTQFTRLRVLHRHMFQAEARCDNFEWTRDTGAVLRFIRDTPHWKTESSRNAHRTALASVLRNLLGFEEETKVYSAAVLEAKTIISKQIGENELQGPAAVNYIEWDKLAEAAAKAKNGSTDKALMAIYTFIPPRRLLDYSLMRVVRSGHAAAETRDPAHNYLQLDGHDQPVAFVFNRYKTAPSFGQQFIPVQRHLAEVLARYLADHQIPHGAPLFPHRHGGTHPNFSRVVSDTFRRHVGRPVSVDLLRHAFITMALAKRPTLNERAELATQMAHSVATQAQYEVLQHH